jgi:hypothetical protein
VSGLKIIDTAGDPPSHASLHVRSAKEDLLIGGDVLIPLMSFFKTGVAFGADMEPDRAIKKRVEVLDMLASDRIPLLGYHFPWPRTGRVERQARSVCNQLTGRMSTYSCPIQPCSRFKSLGSRSPDLDSRLYCSASSLATHCRQALTHDGSMDTSKAPPRRLLLLRLCGFQT